MHDVDDIEDWVKSVQDDVNVFRMKIRLRIEREINYIGEEGERLGDRYERYS